MTTHEEKSHNHIDYSENRAKTEATIRVSAFFLRVSRELRHKKTEFRFCFKTVLPSKKRRRERNLPSFATLRLHSLDKIETKKKMKKEMTTSRGTDTHWHSLKRHTQKNTLTHGSYLVKIPKFSSQERKNLLFIFVHSLQFDNEAFIFQAQQRRFLFLHSVSRYQKL